MPRPALLLACLLLVATGLTLLGLAQAARLPAHASTPADATANLGIARDFYSAANEVLATGDASYLEYVVAADLVEHPARSGISGRAGLGQALVARGAVFPGLRLVIDDLGAAGEDEVAVRLHAEGAATGSFLGLEFPATVAAWGPIEILRIADGAIAERWAGATELPQLRPLWEAALSTRTDDAPRVMAVRRLTLQPGAEFAVADNPAAWALLIESGTPAVTITPGTDQPWGQPTTRKSGADRTSPLDPGQATALATGTLLVIPANAGFVVRNDGFAPATSLVVAVWVMTTGSPLDLVSMERPAEERQAVALGLGPATTGDVVLAPGVVMNTLATAPDIDVPGGAMVMAGRIVLAPDATIPFAAGGPLVLAVESGSLDLAVTGEAMLTIDRDGLYGELSGQKALAAGDGAILPTAATSVWRANGDKTVVVLAVTIIVPAE